MNAIRLTFFPSENTPKFVGTSSLSHRLMFERIWTIIVPVYSELTNWLSSNWLSSFIIFNRRYEFHYLKVNANYLNFNSQESNCLKKQWSAINYIKPEKNSNWVIKTTVSFFSVNFSPFWVKTFSISDIVLQWSALMRWFQWCPRECVCQWGPQKGLFCQTWPKNLLTKHLSFIPSSWISF